MQQNSQYEKAMISTFTKTHPAIKALTASTNLETTQLPLFILHDPRDKQYNKKSPDYCQSQSIRFTRTLYVKKSTVKMP